MKTFKNIVISIVVLSNVSVSAHGIKYIDAYRGASWGIGIYTSYDKCSYRIKSENSFGEAMLNDNPDLFKGDNNANYTFGIQIARRLNNRIYAETGILYSQKKSLSVSDYSIGNQIMTFDYNGKYLDIPLKLRYYVLQNKHSLYFSFGIVASSNYPDHTSGYFRKISSDTKQEYLITLQPSSVGISGRIGLGVEMMLGENTRIFLEPFYNYSFSPVVKQAQYTDMPMQHFINNIGLSFGIYNFDFNLKDSKKNNKKNLGLTYCPEF